MQGEGAGRAVGEGGPRLLPPAPPGPAPLQVPKAGHACYLDAPEVFNRELLHFLANEILPAA